MIVAIDGPAGAGKSSIARAAADEIGFDFLDTGALYRAVTLAVLRSDLPLHNSVGISELASRCELRPDGKRILLNGEDVSQQIRTPEVTAAIVHVADTLQVRRHLGQIQRQIAAGKNIVTEGRDQGTEVFPDAQCKIFLTASPEERANRRFQQLSKAGQPVLLEDIRTAQDKRDAEDAARPMGALKAAADAEILLTDGMTPAEVLERTLQVIRSCMPSIDA